MGTRPRKKVNTVQIQFPFGVTRPPMEDLLRYLSQDGITPEHLTAIYPDTRKRSFYIKFSSRMEYKRYLAGKNYEGVFEFSNGVQVDVKICKADEDVTVVKIFEVPPEVEDEEIIGQLSGYGSVKKVTWGKCHGINDFQVYNGIRYTYMSVTTEIPNLLEFDGAERRLQYDGAVEKCSGAAKQGTSGFNAPRIYQFDYRSQMRQSK